MSLKKISKKDWIDNLQDDPLENFRAGLKSKESRIRYERTLRSYLMNTLSEIIEGETFEDKIQTLVIKAKEDPKIASDMMVKILMLLRKRTELPTEHKDYLSPNSLRNDFKPFKKLFDMNDIALLWKRIYSMYPESVNTNPLKSRAYTLEEIRTMLEHCKNLMEKAIILVHASSGIRPQAFNFTWEDIQPIFRKDGKIIINQTEEQTNAELVCATLTIYKRSSSEIPAFITPEAYHSLMEWKKEYAHDIGHEPKDTDPVFKTSGFMPKQISVDGIDSRLYKLLKRSQIIKPHLEKGVRRAEVPARMGFRYFFNQQVKNTASVDGLLGSLIKKEYMMDHKGLASFDRNYFKSNIEDLIKEYLPCVPNLTISPTLKLKEESEAKDVIIEQIRAEDKKKIAVLESYSEAVSKLIKRIEALESKKETVN